MKKQTKTGIPPRFTRISEELLCELNEVEWNNRASDLAQAHQASEQAEERKKSVAAQLTSDWKLAKVKESKLANIVATRTEFREVTVEVKYDYERGIVTKTRTDTGEIISTRDMTDKERQAELELQEAEQFEASRKEQA